jgi:hypothetical protein
LTESELSTAPDTYTTVSPTDPSSKCSTNAYSLVLTQFQGQLESRSLIASTQRLTLKVAPTARHVNSSGEQEDTDNASIIGGVSLIEDHNEKESPARRGPSFTAFGPDGVARRRSGSPSGTHSSVHGGWASFGVNVHATATKPLPKKGGFAKVPVSPFINECIPCQWTMLSLRRASVSRNMKLPRCASPNPSAPPSLLTMRLETMRVPKTTSERFLLLRRGVKQ